MVSSEEGIKFFLKNKNVIIDTDCGLGYKAAWLAKLALHWIALRVDISDLFILPQRNIRVTIIYFLKGNIANTGLKKGVIDFTICDQVIMYTEISEQTFSHLDITSDNGEFACYAYSKKALPRELIDTYFRWAIH